jgi:hypothetical protein
MGLVLLSSVPATDITFLCEFFDTPHFLYSWWRESEVDLSFCQNIVSDKTDSSCLSFRGAYGLEFVMTGWARWRSRRLGI